MLTLMLIMTHKVMQSQQGIASGIVPGGQIEEDRRSCEVENEEGEEEEKREEGEESEARTRARGRRRGGRGRGGGRRGR